MTYDELTRQLMTTAKAAHTLMVNRTAFCSAMANICSNPKPGDFVYELSALRKNDFRGLGTLACRDPKTGHATIILLDGRTFQPLENCELWRLPDRACVEEVYRTTHGDIFGPADKAES